MNQNKKRIKGDQDQPSIKDFYQTLKEAWTKSCRSRSRKRSHPTTPPSAESQKVYKKQNTRESPDMSMEPSSQLDGLKQDTLKEKSLPELDNSILRAFEILLKPIRDDIQNLHTELKKDLVDCKQLREENMSLHRRVMQVEAKNLELNKRLCTLENKMLETSVIIHGIQENPWETEAVRQEKLFIAISDTLLGRTLDERLNSARSMLIKGSKRIGTYRSMRTRPISVEFVYKHDAEYLLTNKRYLPQGVYVDKEYCQETEECRKILRPYLKAARKLPLYHKKCRLDDDTLVL